jgi:hypothetical protein
MLYIDSEGPRQSVTNPLQETPYKLAIIESSINPVRQLASTYTKQQCVEMLAKYVRCLGVVPKERIVYHYSWFVHGLTLRVNDEDDLFKVIYKDFYTLASAQLQPTTIMHFQPGNWANTLLDHYWPQYNIEMQKHNEAKSILSLANGGPYDICIESTV